MNNMRENNHNEKNVNMHLGLGNGLCLFQAIATLGKHQYVDRNCNYSGGGLAIGFGGGFAIALSGGIHRNTQCRTVFLASVRCANQYRSFSLAYMKVRRRHDAVAQVAKLSSIKQPYAKDRSGRIAA